LTAHASRLATVPAAAGLAALETTAVIVVLALRGSRSAPFFIGCMALKYVFCALLLRRNAGAWLALLLYEATAMFAALAAPGIPVALRLVELTLAGAVLALLVASLPHFPRTEFSK
jgi:hypothetical protein